MTLVYLDTSAINDLGVDLHLIAKTGQFEFLVSSCQIDELACADPARQILLTKLTWEVTNKQKLLEHIPIMYAETAAELGIRPRLRRLEDYYDQDPLFLSSWRAVTTGLLPAQFMDHYREFVLAFKEGYRRWSNQDSEILRPVVNRLKRTGAPPPSWQDFLAETEAEGWFNEFIYVNLSLYPQFARFLVREDVLHIDYRRLRCTSVGLQYYLASQWLDIFGEGKHARITRGDQVDVRHAFYAGLADCFVTGDTKMRNILAHMVPGNRAKILQPQEFRTCALGLPAKQPIDPRLWARCALDQLFSEQWRQSIREFFVHVKARIPTFLASEASAFAEILGAQLELLGFVSVRSDLELGIAFHLLLPEHLSKLPASIQSDVNQAYDCCNQKVKEYGLKDISAYGAIAHACAERLNMKNSKGFVRALEAEFTALAEEWLADITQYRFGRQSTV